MINERSEGCGTKRSWPTLTHVTITILAKIIKNKMFRPPVLESKQILLEYEASHIHL
jgi:hypothetical protein